MPCNNYLRQEIMHTIIYTLPPLLPESTCHTTTIIMYTLTSRNVLPTAQCIDKTIIIIIRLCKLHLNSSFPIFLFTTQDKMFFPFFDSFYSMKWQHYMFFPSNNRALIIISAYFVTSQCALVLLISLCCHYYYYITHYVHLKTLLFICTYIRGCSFSFFFVYMNNI